MRFGVLRQGLGIAAGGALLLCAVLGIATSTASAQTYVFGRMDLAVPNLPAALITGDFNGDGIPDVAVLNQELTYACIEEDTSCLPGSLSVYLGQPDGTLGSPVNTTLSSTNPLALVAGDFNGDGRLDVAVIYGTLVPLSTGNSVDVLLGNGDGSFQPAVSYGTGQGTASLVTADFNGDGKLDLAVANETDETVSILLGNGDGTFQPHFDYPASIGPDQVVAADFNGDGILDLALAPGFSQENVVILLGNSNGTFQAPIQTGIVAGGIIAGDFNGDETPDLVFGNSIALGNGNGTFQTPTLLDSTGQVLGALAAGDFNGDGKLDLLITDTVVQTGGLGVSVILGNGNGTFQPPSGQPYPFGPSSGASLPVSALTFAPDDFNGDGHLDFAAIVSSEVSVLIGHGDGTFASLADYPTATGVTTGTFVTAGFTNDGYLDFATSTGVEISILLGNGNGTFQPYTDFDTGSQTSALAAGDFNADGNQDLAIAQPENNTVEIFLGNGNGTFQTGTTNATGNQPGAIVTGDFNGDGNLDLAVLDVAGNAISILLGNGDGTFKPQVEYQTMGTPEGLGVGDFNGDGKLDLVVTTDQVVTGYLEVFLGNGDGTFASPTSTPLLAPPNGVVVGDFNNDGDLDVAAQDSNGVELLLGNGNGTFQPPSRISSVGSIYLMVAADLNGDGKLDLAAATDGTPPVFALLGNGNGTFQSPVGLGLPSENGPLASGDFNGDGAVDLAQYDTEVGVDVQLNTPVLALSPRSLTFAGEGVGTTSVPVSVLVSNPGSEAFSLTSVVVAGSGFAQTNNCGSSLATGTNCTVNVTFSPASTGTFSGTLTLTDSVPGSPQVIALTGTGVTGPFASAAPPSVNFSPEPVGTISTPQVVTLTNTGNMVLDLTSGIAIGGFNSGDFQLCAPMAGEGSKCTYQTKLDCGVTTSLNPGASCTVGLAFDPTAPGTRLGTLSFTDNAAGSPQVVALTATGSPTPTVTLSPTSLTFGNQPTGLASAALTVTLSNTGTAALSITSINATGAFAETSNCGTSVAAGASCTINVTFTPSGTGVETGTLTIADNASGSPQAVTLSGTGTAAPVATLSPSSLSFGSEPVGEATPEKTVTLTNTGTAALIISGITASADYVAVSTCKSPIAVGASCAINVIFKPTASGVLAGTVSISDNAPANPQTITLSGTGTAPAVGFSPSGGLVFGPTLAGKSVGPTAAILTNTGAAPLNISSISVGGSVAQGFSQQNNCGSTLAAGAACTINVTFKPPVGGPIEATLTVTDNALGSPQSLPLSGTGEDFSLGIAGTSSQFTVTPGQMASYTVFAASAGGLVATIALACSGAPAASTCSVMPSQLNLSGNPTAEPQAVVTITTTAAGSRALPRAPQGRWPAIPLVAPLLLLLLAVAILKGRGFSPAAGKRLRKKLMRLLGASFGGAEAPPFPGLLFRPLTAILIAAMLMLALTLIIPACGGGMTTTSTTTQPTGTPAGSYMVTVTGTYTSGTTTLQNGVTATLTVQ